VGLIPVLPDKPTAVSQSLSYNYQKKYQVASTGALQDIEPPDANKEWHINFIRFIVQGPYQEVSLWDNSDIVLLLHCGVDAATIYHDGEYNLPVDLTFKGRLAFSTGGVGDNCWIFLKGFVLDKPLK